MSTFNVDSSDYSFGYCATWAGGGAEAIEKIKASAGRIQRTARCIIEGIAGDEIPVADTSSPGTTVEAVGAAAV